MQRMEGRGRRLPLHGDADHAHAHRQGRDPRAPRWLRLRRRSSSEVVARLDKLPPFHKRAVMDPLHLNHPLWIADREIDPSRHIFRVAVPTPGSMRELEKLVGQIVSVPLDRSVPLWELHVCEGLEDGRVAVVAKIHHSRRRRQRRQQPARQRDRRGHVARRAGARLERTPSRARTVRSRASSTRSSRRSCCPALVWRTITRRWSTWSRSAGARRHAAAADPRRRRAPRSTARWARAATSPPTPCRSTRSRPPRHAHGVIAQRRGARRGLGCPAALARRERRAADVRR